MAKSSRSQEGENMQRPYGVRGFGRRWYSGEMPCWGNTFILSFKLLSFPTKQMQLAMNATHGRTTQVMSHKIINFVSIILQKDHSHRDDPLRDKSHNPSPLHPPHHHSRSHLGYMQTPHGRSYQRNSSHATTNDDEPRQRRISRDVSCHRRNPPTSPPQETHTGMSEGRQLHRRSSPDGDDNRSPCVHLSSQQKRPLTSPMSGMRSKKARTIVTSD